ncbi:MAG TPA: tetratricopeptide repeat protein [Chitinophagaceae bacterium]|nr:tetratricopeptide repeat protein [Chitinophagaceae bacterium]
MTKSYFILIAFITFLSITGCNSRSPDTIQTPGMLDNSTEALKSELKKYPDSLALLQKLIETYSDAGEYDSALALTDAQLRKDTANAYLWNMKATLLFENDDTLNAIKALERAVNLYPRPEYLVALGTVYAEVKDPRCLAIADELFKTNKSKSGADAMFIRGLYYTYKDDKLKAIAYYDSCLSMNYTYMFAYREKAIALYNMGKYNDALVVLRRAVTLQNDYDEGYYWMGKCFEKLGRKYEAIQSYQSAILYDKDYTEAKEALQKLKGQH